MKDPRNNPNKYLRPDEPASQEEIIDAIQRLLEREVRAGRKVELDKAITEYEWMTGR
jgi:hypothetical protein